MSVVFLFIVLLMVCVVRVLAIDMMSIELGQTAMQPMAACVFETTVNPPQMKCPNEVHFCSYTGGKYTVGFQFVAPHASLYRFTTNGTAVETFMQVTSPLISLCHNRNYNNGPSIVEIQLSANAIVSIFVAERNPGDNLAYLTVFDITPSMSPTTTKPTTSTPTDSPTRLPSLLPTFTPSHAPSFTPTQLPTRPPTQQPSQQPTHSPTYSKPTLSPSHLPTASPSKAPTTSIPTQTPTTSQPTQSPTRSPTFICPAGTYSNTGNDTQTDMCVKCPAGFYDLPDSLMRTDCEGRMPCEDGYWCGAGAVLDDTYVQVLEHTEIDGTLVIASISEFNVQFTKLVPESVVIFINASSTLPKGVRMVNNEVTSPVGEMEFSVAFTIEADLLQGLSGDGLNQYVDSMRVFGRYGSDPPDLPTFTTKVSIAIQLVSVVINPELFSYSLLIGNVYSGNALSPLPESEVLNPLCSNDLEYTASICSAELLEFTPSTATSALITSDQGSGNKVGFVVDLSSIQPETNWSLPARTVSTCISFDMRLIPLNTSFVNTIDVTIKLLQLCPAGTYSLSGNNDLGCTACAEGYYQSSNGTTQCFPVSPGTEANLDKTGVVDCALGYMSNAESQVCVPCPLGSYADETASTVCKPCPSATFPTTLHVGATSIDECTTDELQNAFKNSKGELESCPPGTTCDFDGATVATIKVNPGFYRTSKISLDVRPCKENFCVPDYYANETTRRRLLYSAQNDSTYCTPHHRGHLCEICETGYVHRGDYRLCETCNEETTAADSSRMAGLFIAFLLVVALGCAFILLRSYENNRPKPFIPIRKTDAVLQVHRSSCCTRTLVKLFSLADLGGTPLKITIGYYQVVAGMAVALRDFLPNYFDQFAYLFSLFSLDFVKAFDFGCSLSDQSHRSGLLLATMLPFGVLGVLRWLEYCIVRRAKHAEVVHVAFMNLYMWILFLIYPSLAKTIFQTFDCVEFDDGMSFIETDPQIDCKSDEYYALCVYAFFCIIVYVLGIPVLFYVLLDRQRFQLNAAPEYEPRVSLAYRQKNLAVQGTVMLWSGYSPKQYNFEVFELVRKLFQTSVFVFASTDTAGQVIFLLGICAMVVIVLGWLEPYVTRSHNALAQWAQWNIFAIAFVALLNRMKLTTPNERVALDALLLLCLVSVPIVAVLSGLETTYFKATERKHISNNKVESAVPKLVRMGSFMDMVNNTNNTGEYSKRAITELQEIILNLSIDMASKQRMRDVVDRLGTKCQEESVVAQLERKFLTSNKNETEMLRQKIAELTEENEDLLFTTNHLNELVYYPEADADMFHTTADGRRRTTMAAATAKPARTSLLGMAQRKLPIFGTANPNLNS